MRIDNTNDEVIDYFDLDFDLNDPGATYPVDLCKNCFEQWEEDKIEIDHPDYSDGDYWCFDCNTRLTDDDN